MPTFDLDEIQATEVNKIYHQTRWLQSFISSPGTEIDKIAELAKGANVNVAPNNLDNSERRGNPEPERPPLMKAIASGRVNVVQYVIAKMAILFEHGANANSEKTATTDRFEIPLILARLYHEETDVVQRLLLLHGADYSVIPKRSSEERDFNRRMMAMTGLPTSTKAELNKAFDEMDEVKKRNREAEEAVTPEDLQKKPDYKTAASRYQQNAKYYADQAEAFYQEHHAFFLKQKATNSGYQKDQSPQLHLGIIEYGLQYIEKAIACAMLVDNAHHAEALKMKATMLSTIDKHHENTDEKDAHKHEITALTEKSDKLSATQSPFSHSTNASLKVRRTNDGGGNYTQLASDEPDSPSRLSPNHPDNLRRRNTTATKKAFAIGVH